MTLAVEETVVRKQRVAENFSRAASTYDAAATLQRRVASRAMLGLPAELRPGMVLDLGSGTGSQTSVLASHYPAAHIVGMDMAMGMLQHAKARNQNLAWCSGDIEALPFQEDSFELVFSSLAIQWCQLGRVLSEVARVLKPGGVFVFATLAAGTMEELDKAWRRVDSHVHVNGFERFEVQKQRINNSPLTPFSLKQQSETLYYQSVNEMLRELKALGVNTVHSRSQGLMTRRRLLNLQQAYEGFRSERGLPLTYRTVYGILKKPSIDV